MSVDRLITDAEPWNLKATALVLDRILGPARMGALAEAEAVEMSGIDPVSVRAKAMQPIVA